MARPRLDIGDWTFTWDPDKAETNFAKHHVSFVEAAWSFLDPHGWLGIDTEDPTREKIIAYSSEQRLLLTVFTEVHGSTIRIISARRATPSERKTYEEGEELGEDDRNPYAADLERRGIRILASALPRGSRSFAEFRRLRRAG